jgi:hypothetical protein
VVPAGKRQNEFRSRCASHPRTRPFPFCYLIAIDTELADAQQLHSAAGGSTIQSYQHSKKPIKAAKNNGHSSKATCPGPEAQYYGGESCIAVLDS